MKKLLLISSLCLAFSNLAFAQHWEHGGNDVHEHGHDNFIPPVQTLDNHERHEIGNSEHWNNNWSNQGNHYGWNKEDREHNDWRRDSHPPVRTLPPNYHWRGGFVRDDIDWWRRGHWEHSHHNGRWGWWWVLGGLWYFYDAPVYPYPVINVPPNITIYPNESVENVRYYCPTSGNYYPYSAVCTVPWERVITETPLYYPPIY